MRKTSAGRVASVDGFIRIRHSSSIRDSGSHDSYYYKIDDVEFETTAEAAKLIDAKSRYRIYYLPGSDIMVNIESIGP